jgi:hypothetical protein
MSAFIIENVITSDSTLKLVAADGREVRIELEGDCCSTSFFDDHSKLDVRDLLGQRLMDVSDAGRDAPDPDPIPHRDDSQEYHALHIRTDRASITVDWRNESNGYYGGTARIWYEGDEVDRYSRNRTLAERLQ